MDVTTRRPLADLSEMYGDEMLAHELALEERMRTLGTERVRKQIAQARASGTEAGTSYGKTLVAMSVDTIADGIKSFIEKATQPGAGRRHAAVKYLTQIDPEIAAFIAIRTVVDGLTGKRVLLQRTAITIATRLEDEVRFSIFQGDDKPAFKRAEKRAKGGAYHRRKASMGGFERKSREEREVDQWQAWPEQAKLHVGMAMVDMILSTELVEIETSVIRRTDTVKRLVPTAKLLEWIDKESARSELLFPSQLPMVVPPLPWSTPYDGGYLSKDAQGRALMVKSSNVAYLTELADSAEDMPAVYGALNALQETRWRINPRTHAVARELWELAPEGTPLPSREDFAFAPCPSCHAMVEMPSMNTRAKSDHACFEDGDVLHKWKKAAFAQHSANVSLRSKRMVTAKTLKVADTLAGYEAIYFPYNLDFRGRVYALPSFNPQGADMTKGLIHFADGMAIEDGVAAGWLAIHGANVYGYDKASLDDRIAWVEDRAEMIEACAVDPIANTAWMAADKPWQFLAFCYEWADFLETGYGYVSHLPIALDGSCSGIQHFSAMLCDTVGGEAVNLVPQEVPADIYQRVCDRVIEKLKEDASELNATILRGSPLGGKETPHRGKDKSPEVTSPKVTSPKVSAMATGWLALEPNRKATKRQVMTLPYGSTKYSCREYTEAWLKDRLSEGAPDPFPEGTRFLATVYMADLIWDAIGEVVVAARQAMDWLQQCAKAVAKSELPVYWVAPSGFPVMQKYTNYHSRRVATRLGDATVRLSLQEEQDTINKRRMQNAISPNFVHSLDASHLVLTTDLAANNGIGSFAMIHDSFGTHAANTEMLAACLREAFVGLYHETDILGDFRKQIMRQVEDDNAEEVPTVPTKGTLDVSVVRGSDFFFA